MKKVLFVAAVAVLGLTSCKKNWNCECKVTVSNVSTTQTSAINGATKKNATDACNTVQASYNTVYSTGTCELK